MQMLFKNAWCVLRFLTGHAIHRTQNITAFLMGQNQQFEGATQALKNARDMLDPARQVPAAELHYSQMNRAQIA
jgi:hypothetical protein